MRKSLIKEEICRVKAMIKPVEKSMMSTYTEELEKTIEEAKGKYGNYLYHYTSIDALMGIIEKKEFWLGNTANMNDSSELMDFTNRIINVVMERLSSSNDPIAIINSNASDIIYDITQGIKNHYPYAMCFSYGDEDASLWERYADSARGVCIVFDIEKLYQLFFGGNMILDHVFYDYNEKQHEFVQIILDYIKRKETGFSSIEGVISNLALCAACHKHKGFSSEKEVRLVSLIQPNKNERIFTKSNSSIKSMMRIDLIDLCKTKGVEFQDIFSGVILGPRSKQRVVDLQEYLEFWGYNELAQKIKNSECPLR